MLEWVRSHRDEIATWAWCLPLLLVPLAFGVLGWEFRWTSDDGFINVRIVRNILEGWGPVFNAGERVEAYTSPLWIGMLSALGFVGLRVEWAAVGAGIAGSVLGIGCAQLGAIALRLGERPTAREALARRIVPAGAAVYLAVPVAWDYATSGLENGLSLAWLGAAFCAVGYLLTSDDGAPPRRQLEGTAVLVGLGPLVRPELALFSIAFLVAIAVRIRRASEARFPWKRWLRVAALAGALPVAYQIFRMGYFATLVPNTAVAKTAFGSRWEQGGYFTWNFFGLYLLPLPMAVLTAELVGALTGSRRPEDLSRRIALVGPAIAGLAYCLYVIRMGGGFMHGRLFLPAFFGMLLPVAAVPLQASSRLERYVRGAGFAIVVGWAVYCATSIRVAKENYHGIGDERGWYSREAGHPNPVTTEHYSDFWFIDGVPGLEEILGERCTPEKHPGVSDGELDGDRCPPSVYVDRDKEGTLRPDFEFYPLRDRVRRGDNDLAVSRMALGLKSLDLGRRVHVADRGGLADPISARLEIESRGRPGHERELPNWWFVARFAEPLPVESARVQFARRALDCGRLGALDDGITGPLTPGKFLRNIPRAFRTRDMVIPRKASKARHEFCGIPEFRRMRAGGPGGVSRDFICPRGFVLSEIETTRDENRDAIASVRPICAPGPGTDVPDEFRRVEGPTYGQKSGSETTSSSCDNPTGLRGLEGKSHRFVSQVSTVCADDAGASQGDGDGFRLVCSEKSAPRGFAVREGALIDAVGLVCSPTSAIE